MHQTISNLCTGSAMSLGEWRGNDFTGWQPSGAAFLLATAEGTRRGVSVVRPKPTLAEKLFEATAAAKIWTSRIAMRLDRDTRNRFFRLLDRLHDIDEWTEDGEPLALDSYKAFMRAIISIPLRDRPALALMSSGNLLAIWTHLGSKLSVEFKPGDRVRWVLTEERDGVMDRLAGDTGFAGLKAQLVANGAEKWLS